MSGYAIGIFHDWSHRVHSIDAACCDRHMSHVAWSVCVFVCLLGTQASYAKTAELTDMPSGGGAYSCVH